MTATDLIERLREIGATIEANGEKLFVRFPEANRQQVETPRPKPERLKPQVIKALTEQRLAQRHQAEIAWETREHDPYWQRAMDTLKRLCQLDWPIGLGAWLEENANAPYRSLYVTVPNEIDRVWDARAPLGELQAVLDRWAGAHREALTLYEEKCGK